MRIFVLNWRDMGNPTAGGAELAVQNITKVLNRKGHKVTFFTSAFKGGKKEEVKDGVRIIRKGTRYTVYFHAMLYYMSHHKDFDSIIESVSAVPFFTPLYSFGKRRIIIPHHVNGAVIFKEIPLPTALIAYLAERSIPLVYRNTNFVVPSRAVADEFKTHGVKENQLTVSYFNAMSLQIKRSTTRKFRTPTLITITRLMKYKRVDMLLDTLKEINKTTNTKLIVVGLGTQFEILKDYAKEIGIANKVTFTGYLNEKEKIALLSKSWAFVTASEREGFGVSVLEAERCGTPIVAFDNGGLKEVVKNNYSGFIIKEGESKQFTEAILKIIKDKKLRMRMSENSIIYSKSFNEEKEIYKIEKILHGKGLIAQKDVYPITTVMGKSVNEV